MNDFADLYDKFYVDRKTRDPKTFINIYDENRMFIENQDLSTSNPNFKYVIQVIADYGIALSYYGSNTKAIPYLDKADKLFKEYSALGTEDLVKMPMYETLIWERGSTNHGLKNYKMAAKDFQYLVDNYPDNDKYKKALISSKTIKTKKILNTIWGLSIVAFVWHTLGTVNGDKNKDYFLWAGIALVVVGFAMQIMNSMIKSSIVKKSN